MCRSSQQCCDDVIFPYFSKNIFFKCCQLLKIIFPVKNDFLLSTTVQKYHSISSNFQITFSKKKKKKLATFLGLGQCNKTFISYVVIVK